MTKDQALAELRKELLTHERIAKLLYDCARDYADEVLRRGYNTTDAEALIRYSGVAAGAEKFIESLIKTDRIKDYGNENIRRD